MPPTEDKEINPQVNLVVGDRDAEGGAEETDLHRMDQQLQEAVQRAYSGEEAEVEEVEPAPQTKVDGEQPTESADAGRDNDESEPVGAVKLPDGPMSSDDEDAASETADADAADPPYENDNQSDKENGTDSSTQGSDVGEEEWEAESNGHEDREADNPAHANCM